MTISTESFQALKAEQTARIVLRDTALYTQILALIGAASALSQNQQHELLLYALPVMSLVMSSIYVSNDIYVSRISKFIASHDASDVHSRWESWHRRSLVGYVLPKVLRTISVLIVFIILPAASAALAVGLLSLTDISSHIMSIAVFAIAAVLTLFLVTLFH